MKKFLVLFLLFLPFSTVKAYEEPVAGITVSLENIEHAQADIKRDVPLPFIYQIYTYGLCEKYEVNYELALSVMDAESEGEIKAFNINNNGTVDKGLMQINSINYEWLREELGITDFYNPWQNIKCGVFILGDISKRYTELHQILMSYNMGERRMRELNKQGVCSSRYSRRIVEKINRLKGETHD